MAEHPKITLTDAVSDANAAELDIYAAVDNDASAEGLEFLLGRYGTALERLAAVESQHEREQPFARRGDLRPIGPIVERFIDGLEKT